MKTTPRKIYTSKTTLKKTSIWKTTVKSLIQNKTILEKTSLSMITNLTA